MIREIKKEREREKGRRVEEGRGEGRVEETRAITKSVGEQRGKLEENGFWWTHLEDLAATKAELVVGRGVKVVLRDRLHRGASAHSAGVGFLLGFCAPRSFNGDGRRARGVARARQPMRFLARGSERASFGCVDGRSLGRWVRRSRSP